MSLWMYKGAIWSRRACPMAHLCRVFSPVVALKDHTAVADEAGTPSMRHGYLSAAFFEKYPGFGCVQQQLMLTYSTGLRIRLVCISNAYPEAAGLPRAGHGLHRLSPRCLWKGSSLYGYVKIKSIEKCCVIKLAQQTQLASLVCKLI